MTNLQLTIFGCIYIFYSLIWVIALDVNSIMYYTDFKKEIPNKKKRLLLFLFVGLFAQLVIGISFIYIKSEVTIKKLIKYFTY